MFQKISVGKDPVAKLLGLQLLTLQQFGGHQIIMSLEINVGNDVVTSLRTNIGNDLMATKSSLVKYGANHLVTTTSFHPCLRVYITCNKSNL